MPKRPTASKPIKRIKPGTLKPLSTKRRTRPLGPFSYLLMCTLYQLPLEHRYGAVLERHLSDQYGELIDLAQVYVALQRLAKEDKGFIKGTEVTAPTGYNHSVIVYEITDRGKEALAHAALFYKMLAAAAPD